MAKTNIAIGVDPGNVWKHSMLSGYQYQLEKQEKAEEKYIRAYEQATKTTYTLKPDVVQGGNKKDLYDRLNDLQPLRDKVSETILETTKTWMKLNVYIDSVESIKLRLLLRLLYLNGMDYKGAGNKMRIGRDEKMSILHNQALGLVKVDPI